MDADKSLVAWHSGANVAKSVESANALLNLREKISQNTALVSDEWLDRLIKWADEKYLPNNETQLHKPQMCIHGKCPLECDFTPFYREHFPRDKEKLRKVTGLMLEHNCIDELPNEFGNLTELEFLYIDGLKSFPNSILKLKKIKWIGFSNTYGNKNAEITLPKELSCMSEMRVFGLNYHHLKRFPRVILKFDKLYGLSLMGCGLSYIPRGFEVLSKHMGVLMLNFNPLKNVPTSLCKCTKIWWLGLNGCGLTALPKRFARLQNLQYLILSNNDFIEFPQVIFELKNLKSLHINKNLITLEINKKLQEMGVEVHLNDF